MADFESIVGAATKSVVTVVLTAGIGAYAAWRGVLTKAAVKSCDKLVSEVLTPAMVIFKVTPTAVLSQQVMYLGRCVSYRWSPTSVWRSVR